MTPAASGGAGQVRRISRVVSDIARATAFYREALGFRELTREPLDAATLTALGLDDNRAEMAVMRLGLQEIALVRFAAAGRPYPADSRSDDLWFQHLAIVVGDMESGYARLCRHAGWRPISLGGPQTLPPENGGVQAFKFRDPDGHPLELIRFPRRPDRHGPEWPFLGIDHSALAVAATGRSVGFYAGLGLHVEKRSLNVGSAQARLDGLPEALVEVTSLRPAASGGAGLELLAYRPPGRPAGPCRPNDAATDWTTLAVGPGDAALPRTVRDPDGHLLLLVNQGEGGGGATGLPA